MMMANMMVMLVMMIMMVMLIMIKIRILNVEYIWLTSLNAMQIKIYFDVAYEFKQLI